MAEVSVSKKSMESTRGGESTRNRREFLSSRERSERLDSALSLRKRFSGLLSKSALNSVQRGLDLKRIAALHSVQRGLDLKRIAALHSVQRVHRF
ncbi:hypothetical protein V511_13820 [Mesotoga sp. Brook.08.YT.4.2.5.1]|nr:hypothetical protein V511_13820 [Mesotoga sp. Brook.08.YT.4.2.5.1]PNS41225.1 hypothetical protein RJ60_05390 [Mesotoga sp. B105.6.4]PVD17012.1 hypothetical protein V512_008785 [Mesotoga sp. Brook.08.105.5.1]RAO97029.1 hypothetical protein M388_12155 [Mesotoga sp. Brook.08.YT.4.2.5.4.]RDI93427.1 hypothetical protein Q502_05520 [Mesotoga sp. Brook.08.YT.4.2.5.2.]